MTAEKPPWCGHCDQRTRLICVMPVPDNPQRDVVTRCSACHPLADKRRCGRHVGPPGMHCVLCDITRPAEERSASRRDMAEDLAALRERIAG